LLGTDVPREVGFTVAVRANVAVLIERLSALAAVLANRFVEEKLVTIAVAAAGDELSNSWVRKVTRVTVGMRFAVVAAVTGETSVPWVWVDNIEGVMALIGRAVGANALPCGIVVETSMKGANALNALAAIGVVHLRPPVSLSQSAGKSAFRSTMIAHRQHTVKRSRKQISASSSFVAPSAGKSHQHANATTEPSSEA
jgi:hypothetical protein